MAPIYLDYNASDRPQIDTKHEFRGAKRSNQRIQMLSLRKDLQ